MDQSLAESGTKRRRHSKRSSSNGERHHKSKNENKAPSNTTSLTIDDSNIQGNNTVSITNETVDTTNDMITNDQINSESNQSNMNVKKRDIQFTDEEIDRLLAIDPNDTLDEIKMAKQNFIEVLEEKKLLNNYFKDLEKIQPKRRSDMSFGITKNSKRYRFDSIDKNVYGGMNDISGDSTHSFDINQNILLGDDQFDIYQDNAFSYKPQNVQDEQMVDDLYTHIRKQNNPNSSAIQNDYSTKSITANDVSNEIPITDPPMNESRQDDKSIPSQFHQLSPNNSSDQMNDSIPSNETPQINQSGEINDPNLTQSQEQIVEEETDDENSWSKNSISSNGNIPDTRRKLFLTSNINDTNLSSDTNEIDNFEGIV